MSKGPIALLVWALLATFAAVWLWLGRQSARDDRDQLRRVTIHACNLVHFSASSLRNAALQQQKEDTDSRRHAVRRHALAVDGFSGLSPSCAIDPARGEALMERAFGVAESGGQAADVIALADELMTVFPVRVLEDERFSPRLR